MISVCMIVKNEEKLLPQALASVKNLADEIIVVDTGSTDGTMPFVQQKINLWRKNGGPRMRLFKKTWNDDFSDMRNYSISLARQPWILILDADEKLVEKAPVRDFLKNLHPDCSAVAVELQDIQGGNIDVRTSSLRLFRNGYIKYEDYIHNRPTLKTDMIAKCNHVVVEHYGYDFALIGEERKQAKIKRTGSALQKRITENPEDWKAYFYLAEFYGMYATDNEQREKAIHYGLIYLRAKEKIGANFSTTIYVTLATLYLAVGKEKEALDIIQQGFRDIPDDPDLASVLSNLGLSKHNFRFVIEAAHRYFSGYQRLQKLDYSPDSRFYFSLKQENLVLHTYRYSMALFQEGLVALSRLNGHSMPEAMQVELRQNLKNLGLEHFLTSPPTPINNQISDIKAQLQNLEAA